jgi:hypothetical protein
MTKEEEEKKNLPFSMFIAWREEKKKKTFVCACTYVRSTNEKIVRSTNRKREKNNNNNNHSPPL